MKAAEVAEHSPRRTKKQRFEADRLREAALDRRAEQSGRAFSALKRRLRSFQDRHAVARRGALQKHMVLGGSPVAGDFS